MENFISISFGAVFLWILAIFGLTFFVIESKAFSWFRHVLTRLAFFKALLDCYFCTACWVATFSLLVIAPPLKLAYLLLFGGASGSYAIHKILLLLEAKTQKIALDLYPPNES